MLTVLATDKVSSEGLAALREDSRFEVVQVDDSGSDDFYEALARAHALVVRSATAVGPEILDRADFLRFVGRAGVGVDNVDIDLASRRGVAVYNAPSGNTVAAAELTMALVLSLIRSVPAAELSIRGGEWDRARFKGTELRGKTLGLVGAGRVGGEVARRCQAFDMDCIVYDPYLTEARATELAVRLVPLEEVWTEADVISIHVPLTAETDGLVDEVALSQMKRSAIVVNVSRGGVIDEDALTAALWNGQIAGAALDVYAKEPLPDDSPLRRAPNLVLTPHLGGSTAEAQVEVAREIAAHVVACLIDDDVSGAVNADQIN